ncbi:MAG: hypothetical protein JXJ19_01540 [Elusimicrobia bacterium]|nr:hypothetical protein [Elusimicrobiota bacterium]
MKKTAKLVLGLMLLCTLPLRAVMIEFNGAVDLTYYDWDSDGASGGTPMFDPYEVYLLGTVDVAEDVMGYFELRTEHADVVALRQGYMDWNITEPFGIRMGYFYQPLGQYWKNYYASTRKLASYAIPMRMINVTPWGDSGIMFKGEFPVSSTKLNYAVAVTNGLNDAYIAAAKPRDSRQTRDNNDNKTLGGRIGFVPMGGLEVGVSGNTAKYDLSNDKDLTFTDIDISYYTSDLDIRGEWVQSEADDYLTDDSITTSGYFAHIAYKVARDVMGLNYIEPALRYDSIDAGRIMGDRFNIDPALQGVVSRISYGLNISPRDNFVLKFEYSMIAEEESDGELDNDAFYMQGCINF